MNLLICEGQTEESSCSSHTFVIVTNDWEPQSNMDRFWNPLTVLCTECGHQVNIGAYWIGNLDEMEKTP